MNRITCVECAVVFEGETKKWKTCSEECRKNRNLRNVKQHNIKRRGMLSRQIRECRWCKETGLEPHRQFCNDDCRKARAKDLSNNRKRTIKIVCCLHCQKERQLQNAKKPCRCTMKKRLQKTCVVCGKIHSKYYSCCSRECGFELQRQSRRVPESIKRIKKSITKLERKILSFEKRFVSPCVDCGVTCDGNRCNHCRIRKSKSDRISRAKCTNQDGTKTCKACGNLFRVDYEHLARKFCSENCRNKNKKRIDKIYRKIRKRKRRVKIRAVATDSVSDDQIFSRDKWKCVYCKSRVHKCDGINFGDYKMATIDHVIPLSKGGDDTESNKACACFECNCIKKVDKEWMLF